MGYESQAREEAAFAVKLSAGLPREETLSMQAELALLSNDWPRAIEVLKSLVLFYPDDIDYGLKLAQAQSNGSDSAAALLTLSNIRRAGLSRADTARIDLLLAQKQLNVSEFREAIAAADRAIDAGTALDLRPVRARGLWIKASCLERLGKDKESSEASSESQAIYRQAGDKQGLAIAIMMAGDVLYDKGQTSEARKNFESSLQLFREIGHRRNMGIVLERIGNSYFDEGKLAESSQNYEEALRAYKDVRWESGIGDVAGNIANVQDLQGDITLALQSNQQALIAFEHDGDKRGTAATLDNIGTLQLEQGLLDYADDSFHRAEAIYRQIAYPRGLAYSLVGKGDVLLARNDIQGATQQYEQASKAIDGLDEPSVQVMVKSSLSGADFWQGRSDQAMASLRQAIALSTKEGNHSALTNEYALLSRCYLEKKHTKEALAAAQQSVSESRLQAGPRRQLTATLAQVRAEVAEGNNRAAQAEIQVALRAAQKYGYAPMELELRMLLAQTDSKPGDRRQKLQVLSREAEEKTWKLLASEANKATES